MGRRGVGGRVFPVRSPGLRDAARNALALVRGEKRLAAAAWVLLALLLGAILAGDWAAVSGNPAYFSGPGQPLLHEFDSYYFLRLARDLREGTYSRRDPLRAQERPAPPPPLSMLLAGGAAVSGASLEMTGAVLPPVLALGLPILLGFCGRLLDNRWFGILAALAACSAFYLYSRTCLGYLDTDCLNPAFLLLTPLFLYQFTLRKGRCGWLWLVGWAVCLALFLWWWPQGASVAAGLSLLSYALSFPVPSSRGERLFKYGLGVALAAGLVLLGLEFLGKVETGIPAFKSIITHVKLILEGNEQVPSVGGSIQELASQLPSSVLEDIAAFPGAVLLAEVGLMALAVIRRRFTLFLLPLVVFASASVFSQRFMIFTAPCYGLGYGYFYVLLTERLAWMRGRSWARFALLALMAGMLWPSYARIFKWHSTPPLNSGEIPLVEAVRSGVPRGATVWAWWDYGYFLQYMGRRPTICDGGLTSEEALRPLAAPFTLSDPDVAARWLRFVSWRGVDGWVTLGQEMGGFQQASAFLARAFAQPDMIGELAAAAGLPRDRDWPAFLLPADQEVVLYLNRHTIDLAYWWYTFGTDTLRGPGHVPAELVDRRPLAEFEVDYAAGLFTRRLDRAGLRVAEVVDVRRGGVARYPGTPGARAAAVVYRDEGLVYFVARELMDTLAFRLLYAPLGEAAPGFTPLYRDPAAGGVWRADRP